MRAPQGRSASQPFPPPLGQRELVITSISPPANAGWRCSSKPAVLGLIGAIASGKSFVAQFLVSLGAVHLDADAAGHDVLRDPDVVAAIQSRWGAEVVAEDGSVRRSEVARRVFGEDAIQREERRFLEELTHPRIRKRLERTIQEAACSRVDEPKMVLDAPLLLEAGWDTVCREIWFVHASPEQRLQRVAARGWTADELAAREKSQWALAAKRARADFVVDNSGTRAQTERQVASLWRQFVGQCAQDNGAPNGLHPQA